MAANVEILAMVRIGLLKGTFVVRFIQNLAATTARLVMRLTTQNPISNRPSFAVEAGGMGYPASWAIRRNQSMALLTAQRMAFFGCPP